MSFSTFLYDKLHHLDIIFDSELRLKKIKKESISPCKIRETDRQTNRQRQKRETERERQGDRGVMHAQECPLFSLHIVWVIHTSTATNLTGFDSLIWCDSV